MRPLLQELRRLGNGVLEYLVELLVQQFTETDRLKGDYYVPNRAGRAHMFDCASRKGKLRRDSCFWKFGLVVETICGIFLVPLKNVKRVE